jgi:hypothetical protein
VLVISEDSTRIKELRILQTSNLRTLSLPHSIDAIE